MKNFFAACLVAVLLALTEGQPVSEHQNVNNHVIQKRHVQVVGGAKQNGEEQNVNNHVIQKREAQVAGGAKQNGEEQNVNNHVIQKREAQIAGDVMQNEKEQNVNDQVIQKRDVQEVVGRARQDREVQEALSREGNYAVQGRGFQKVVASDEGGPIVQISQDAKRAGCMAGMNCNKAMEEEEEE